jgi:hypothetical protein
MHTGLSHGQGREKVRTVDKRLYETMQRGDLEVNDVGSSARCEGMTWPLMTVTSVELRNPCQVC